MTLGELTRQYQASLEANRRNPDEDALAEDLKDAERAMEDKWIALALDELTR